MGRYLWANSSFLSAVSKVGCLQFLEGTIMKLYDYHAICQENGQINRFGQRTGEAGQGLLLAYYIYNPRDFRVPLPLVVSR